MKRLIYILVLFLPFLTGCHKNDSAYVVGFYNLENLFDTVHDEGKNDFAYLPGGSNAWTEERYRIKLHSMAEAIEAMAKENGRFHAVLGVAEIENDHVLQDLVAQPELIPAGYRFIHYEGPDGRGIDVALLYRPEDFRVLESRALPYNFDSDIVFDYTPEEQRSFRTRDVLMVRGEFAGEPFAFLVAHLPSRQNGKGGELRSRGAEIMYDEARRLEREHPGIKIVVMGDMNDDPTDESMVRYMHSEEDVTDVQDGEFFSPFLSMIKNGYGTLEYRGAWNIFDIILVNDEVVNDAEGLRIQKIEAGRFYGRVFNSPLLTQQDGEFAGTPKRTFSRGKFIGGYSDHYPTFIVLSK